MKRSGSMIMGLLLTATLVCSCASFVHAAPADHVDFTVDGTDYVVSERYTEDEMPAGFERETIKINDRTYSEPTNDKMTLLYLKPAADTSGSGEFYIYDKDSSSVEKFYFLGTAKNYVIPLSGDSSAFPRLIETTITVDDVEIPVYQLEESTNDFYYVYGVDSENEEEWYTYRESTGQVARADTYALFLTSRALEDEAAEDEEASDTEDKPSPLSKLSGENTRNILVVVVIVVAIIIIFLINLHVFRRSDDDDDIWAEPDDDDDEVEEEEDALDPAPVVEAKPAAKPAAQPSQTTSQSAPSSEPADPEAEDKLPTEEAILKNAMAGIMDDEKPQKVTSAIDSLPKKNPSSEGTTKGEEITMIDLNNL